MTSILYDFSRVCPRVYFRSGPVPPRWFGDGNGPLSPGGLVGGWVAGWLDWWGSTAKWNEAYACV